MVPDQVWKRISCSEVATTRPLVRREEGGYGMTVRAVCTI